MYEHRSEPMLSPRHFLRRLSQHIVCALGVVLVSLLIGMLGYHVLAGQAWVDAFLNAAMLLGGMGPVGTISTPAGKIFAALFALYAGLVLIAVTTLLLAPVLHRILHSVHLEAQSEEADRQ